jgi:hypothetical protein
MKKVVISIGIFLFACTSRKPVLFSNHESINLGKINIDSVVSFDYKLYNRGTANLIIFSSACSCECTLSDLKSNQVVPPNDSIVIKVEVKPQKDYINKFVNVNCMFKTNADSVFKKLGIGYLVVQ